MVSEVFEALLDSDISTEPLAIEDVLYLEIGVHYLKICALFEFLSTFFLGGGGGGGVGRARAT